MRKNWAKSSHLRPAAALLASVIPASNAMAAAVWDEAPRWICRAEQMHTCTADRCTDAAGIAVFQIDFRTDELRVAGSEKKFAEHVIVKKTFGSLGFSKIGLDSGDSVQFSIAADRSPAASSGARRFSSSRGMFPEIVSYYGTCFPSD